MTYSWRKLSRALPLVAAAIVMSGSVFAQKGPPAGKGPPVGKHEDPPGKSPPGHEKDAQAAATDAGKRDDARGPEREKAHKKTKDVLDGRADPSKAKTAERKAEKDRIKDHAKRTGKTVPLPALKNELARHARRIARLARLGEIAEKAADTEASERIDKLTSQEMTRHERWMDKHATEPVGGSK